MSSVFLTAAVTPPLTSPSKPKIKINKRIMNFTTVCKSKDNHNESESFSFNNSFALG